MPRMSGKMIDDAMVRSAMKASRLAREVAKKDAIIKALADALTERGMHTYECAAWLSNGDFDESACSCGLSPALRLAGRLP